MKSSNLKLVRAAAEGMPNINRRRAMLGAGAAAAALAATSLPAEPATSQLPALIEAHRVVQAQIDAEAYGEIDQPNFEEACALEWATIHDIIGYAPLTLGEAREKMAYLAACATYIDGDARELEQLARSFLIEPGTIAEFRMEYPNEVVS